MFKGDLVVSRALNIEHRTLSIGSPIGWLPWASEAFARAAREQKPVLLSITASWCRACHEMDRTTYADERVASVIRDAFVPIRVDTDRRPDINERYNLGGWPTTAFLTARGDLLGGGTFVPADQMVGILHRVAEAVRTRGAEITRAQTVAGSSEPPPSGDPPSPDALIAMVFDTFDEVHGGFGVAPKFPLTAPLHLALAVYETQGEERYRQVVERTLDAIRDGGLHDTGHGGFYRYATTREWQLPHVEKLLETNAALLRAYAHASRVFSDDSYSRMAAELVTYIRQHLSCPSGGYVGSEGDTIVYADSSAAASAALLAASTMLDDAGLGREALEQLERVALASYRPGQGIAHCVDGAARVSGLLADYVAMIHALLDAKEASDGEPYGMLAEELAHYMLRMMWDEHSSGFFDRAHDAAEVGLLNERRKPFVSNCEAARALARVARVSDEPDFRTRAEAAARAAAPYAATQGPLAAHYLLAMRELSLR
jgi:hypothetical protein